MRRVCLMLAAGAVLAAGCNPFPKKKYDLHPKKVEEFNPPPAEARYEEPPESVYRKPPPVKDQASKMGSGMPMTSGPGNR